jgi:hypothetical protein
LKAKFSEASTEGLGFKVPDFSDEVSWRVTLEISAALYFILVSHIDHATLKVKHI